ncbi:MAG: hypothetical protein DRN30_01825 [Thermoplasmata archaeon]|nr:MAG: hypothetical protein DRN30_01825 [Thermoplasmata archaeon]
MAFGNNTAIQEAPASRISIEEFNAGERERVRSGFGLYTEPEPVTPQPSGRDSYDFTDERIANLNRAEYEQIIDSFSGIPPKENVNPIQPQMIQQPTYVPQQTEQVIVPQVNVQQSIQPTVEQAPVDKNDFLANIFGEDSSDINVNTPTAVAPTVPVVPVAPVIPQTVQQTYQTHQTNQVPQPQNDMFRKELAQMALHNRVNPNVVFETLKNIPLENLYQFVMGQAGEAMSQKQQSIIEQQKKDDALSLNMANFSVTNENQVRNVSTRPLYNYDSSSDNY